MLSTDDLVVLYSAIETVTIRKALKAAGLYATTYQGDLQMANTVQIPTVAADNVTASKYTKGSDWKDPENVDISLQPFTLNEAGEVGNKIPYRDLLTSPVNLVARTGIDQGYQMASQLNTYLYDTAVKAAAAALVGAQRGTKDAANAAWVDDSGDIRTSGNGELDPGFMEANLMAIYAWALRAGLAVETGQMGYGVVVTMTSPLWLNLLKRIKAQRYGDALNYQTLREARIANPPAGAVAVVNNMIVVVDDELRAFKRAGGNDVLDADNQHTMLAAAPGTEALQRAVRPPIVQVLTPATNQKGPDAVIRSVRDYDAHVSNPALVAKIQVRRTANG